MNLLRVGKVEALKIYRYRNRYRGKSLFTYRLLTELRIPLPYISDTGIVRKSAIFGTTLTVGHQMVHFTGRVRKCAIFGTALTVGHQNGPLYALRGVPASSLTRQSPGFILSVTWCTVLLIENTLQTINI